MANTYMDIALDGGGGSPGGDAIADVNMGDYDLLFNGGNNTYTVLPSATADVSLQAVFDAIDASNDTGAIVQLLDGDYVIGTKTILPQSTNNITLRGMGPQTVIVHDGSFNGEALKITGTQYLDKAMNNVSAGATSITCTTVGQAAGFVIGDVVHIEGTDVGSLKAIEVNEVATTGNGTTGAVVLKYPLRRTLTSVTMTGNRYAKNMRIENMSFRLDAAPAVDGFGVLVVAGTHCVLENLEANNFNIAPSNPGVGIFYCDGDGAYNQIRRCRVNGSSDSGLTFYNQIGGKILDNFLLNCADTSSASNAGIMLSRYSMDCEVGGNIIEGCESPGIELEAAGGTFCRGTLIRGNKISRAKLLGGIYCTTAKETRIIGNHLEFCTALYAVNLSACLRSAVCDNLFTRNQRGINMGSSSVGTIISGNNLENQTDEGVVVQSSSSDVTISGNSFNGTGDGSMSLNGANITVSGNRIVATSGVGIYIYSSDVLVIGNMINSAGNAITVDNAASNVLITGNNYRGESVSLGSGTNIVAVGNME